MFLRCHTRQKDGKLHHYWSIVETRRCGPRGTVQRPVLYLGEINDSQQAAWRKTIEVFEATLKEPFRVEGKKTMGYELVEQLGWTLPRRRLLSHRRWRRPHRHVEGLRGNGAARLGLRAAVRR